MQECVVEVKNLTREYFARGGILNRKVKTVQALKNLNFNVYRGEIFGLLGPNGAGKSTTINILSTLLAPTSGIAKVLNLNTFGDQKELRKKINFIRGGERCLYWRLSAIDNLKYFSDIYKIPSYIQKKRIPRLLEIVGLTQYSENKVETFSKGMKQKLQIARGLINDPEVLFLDEPTLGLDPLSARDFRSLILRLKNMNKTIILTTHYMHDVEILCDRIAIIKNGKLLLCTNIDNLKKSNIGFKTIDIVSLNEIPKSYMDFILDKYKIHNIIRHESDGREVYTFQIINSQDISPIKDKFKDIAIIQTRDSSLEDMYIKLIEKNSLTSDLK